MTQIRHGEWCAARFWAVVLQREDAGVVKAGVAVGADGFEGVDYGETGVGKEVVARLIHDASKRAGKSFEAVNCASVPRELFEAHLFGHRKGSFTGAVADQPGVIRGNDGGRFSLMRLGSSVSRCR